jgi:hypothetical protein
MVKKGKGFWDDLFPDREAAAKKAAEDAAKEHERLQNRSGWAKAGDTILDSFMPILGHIAKQHIQGGAKGDQRRFMANRAVPNKVPNAVRVREMRDVKDYNRNQQQRVFDMEKRQVQSESESIKPIDAKDAGAAFKLQTYISKLQQILGQKSDLFSQLQASPFNDLNQLKGTTKQAGLLTMLVSKAELVQSFNEMVAYVALFFKDIQTDNRVRDRMYAAYFTPLIDQMRQLSQAYPALFQGLPDPERGGPGAQKPPRSGSVYDLVRKETRDMYSLLNVAADNIEDGIFRPIGAKDVAEYSRDNNVNAVFAANPPPPGPVVPSLPVQQAQQQVQLAEANQRAQQAKTDELAMADPFNPMGDASLSPQQQQQFMAVYYNKKQYPDVPDDAPFNMDNLQQGITPEFAQSYNDWVATRRLLAAPEQQAAPPERQEPPRQQQQQAQEATPEQIDNYVVGWARDNGIDTQLRLPLANNQPKGSPSNIIATIHGNLKLAGLKATSAEIIRAITRYNESRPKQAPGPKKKQPASPAQPGQAGPAQQQQAQTKFKSKKIIQNNSDTAAAIIESILGVETSKGALLDPTSTKDLQDVLNVFERRHKTLFDAALAQENNNTRQLAGDQIDPLIRAINQAKNSTAQTEGRDIGDFVGRGMSGGVLNSRAGRELDFVPGQMSQFNSAAPPTQRGYGSHHRPKFAWELEQEAAGPRYIRQDRVAYNMNGGLGMVNPDAEIGTYQVLRMAGEGMSGGVYLPKEYIVQPAGEKEFFGYGVDGDNDVFGMEGGYGSLKRRLSMANPFANSHDYHYKKVQTGYDDAKDFAYGNHEEPMEASQQAHEEEEEKPVDLDENPNPFRVRQENYKVNTGKMKKVSYKMPNM